ncbi:hypothetical protein BDV09DRAFT_165928 [Aspergillus tetrazonus]
MDHTTSIHQLPCHNHRPTFVYRRRSKRAPCRLTMTGLVSLTQFFGRSCRTNSTNMLCVGARKRRKRQAALISQSKKDKTDLRRYALILPRVHKDKVNGSQQLLRPTTLSEAVTMMTRFSTEALERYFAANPCLDHLFTLSKFNALRAFIGNMAALGLRMEDMGDEALSPFSTNIPRPDDKTVVPASLLPTAIQCAFPHHPWLDCFPFPRLRDNLVMAADSFDDTASCVLISWILPTAISGSWFGATPGSHRIGKSPNSFCRNGHGSSRGVRKSSSIVIIGGTGGALRSS